jgi:hypothetical protein
MSSLDAHRRIEATQWLSRCGEADWEGPGPLWLSSIDEWPGPEDPRCGALSETAQAHHDLLIASNPAALSNVFAGTLSRVLLAAAAASDGFSRDEDAWHGPTTRAWEVAWWAALLATYAASQLPMHPDVWEVWLWIEAGHWPCGLANPKEEPADLMIL